MKKGQARGGSLNYAEGLFKRTDVFSYKLWVHYYLPGVTQSNNLSVIRQKGESQNGGNKKAKYARFSEKRTFLTP